MRRFRCKTNEHGAVILSASALAWLKREMARRIAHATGGKFKDCPLRKGDMLQTSYALRIDVASTPDKRGYVYVRFEQAKPVVDGRHL